MPFTDEAPVSPVGRGEGSTPGCGAEGSPSSVNVDSPAFQDCLLLKDGC